MPEPMKPSFRNLTDPSYGKLKDKQNQYLQELTKPHIESFNYFLHEGITKIIENMYPYQFELPNGDRVSLTLQDFVVGKPKKNEKINVSRTVVVYPSECRGRNTSYRSPVQVQVGFSVNGVDGQPVTHSLGLIPIMVKSDACNLSGLSPKELVKKGEEAEEMGGYFIANGIERLLRMLILPRRNYPMCLQRLSWKTRGPLYTEYGISIRCVRPDQIGIVNVLHYLHNGTAVFEFAHLKEMFFVPIIIILKGLLPVSDKFIFDELIRGKEDNSFYKGCVVNMFRQALIQELSTMESVLAYIGQRFRIKTKLPGWFSDADVGRFLYKHCIGIHLDTNLDKFNLLVHITQKLFDLVQGKCASDSPDNPMNQEVLLSGTYYQMFLKEKLDVLLYNLQLVILKQAKAHKSGSENFKMTAEVLMNAFRYSGDLTNSMMYLIATGNATSHSGLGVTQETGLTVVADKLNFMRYISHFRCIHRGAFFAQMRTTSVRKLLPEAWGFLCPVHTPDGTPCGLMNHMSLLCQVQTVTFSTTGIEKVLYSLGVCPLNSLPGDIKSCYIVLLDGKLIGYVSDSMAPGVEQKLRMMKVKGLNKIPPTMEICLLPKTEVASQYPGLFIFTTPARMMRPVINLAYNMVEMIGTLEQVYMNICITQDEAHEGVTTHQELTEASMLSFVGHLTPFSDFNQSPRNMYQCQMGKQTMGVPCHTTQHRSDYKLYSLQTPQTPLVRPVQYDRYEMDNYPLGTNAIVAVISYTGYDMEDAMVINKSSFERGFGHASVYKSDLVELAAISKEYQRNPLMFAADPQGKAFKDGLLDKDGLPPVGRLLQYEEPYFSYVNMQNGEYKVTKYKSREPAYVEHVRICGNEQGTNLLSRVKIMTRTNRNPVIGDKFASRHGQKGVCSMMYPVENLPFTESGMTPDIIFNPHGYPSRMTIGMMIESMAGKASASFGECYDASPFTFSEDDSAIDHFGNMLVKAGYNYYGTERLYSGTDGRELEADIFMGVVYYQRLRHMVSDKFQVRTTGPIDQVTHQPVKGRRRMGGVRFGEMERDALISHGASFLLQDRLLNCSDKSAIVVCTKCGNLLSASKEKPAQTTAAASFESQREWSCLLCKETKHMQLVTVPYVLRYLVAELASMNICMDVKVKS